MQTVIKPHPMMPMQGPAGPIGERGEPGEPGLPAGFEHQTFTLRRGDPGEPGPTLEEFAPLATPPYWKNSGSWSSPSSSAGS